MHLVALLQASEDGDRVVHRGLRDEDGLNSPFQRGVLLDAFSVLVESRRADAAELSARQGRLEQLAAFIDPSAAPAPTIVCSSSMNRMICPWTPRPP